MKHVTREMKALRAGLESCADIPRPEQILVVEWWIKEKIYPYIHRRFNPFTVGDLCRYFGISLCGYMHYRWQRIS